MADPMTLIGVEVPRAPVQHFAGEATAAGDLAVGDVRLLEHAVRAALECAPPEQIRMIVGEPDQGVFDMVREYGVPEVDLGNWLSALADAAKRAGPRDCAVFLRASVPMKSYASLHRAIDTIQQWPELRRIEPAFRPTRQALSTCFSLDRAEQGAGIALTPWALPTGECGVPCPSFEVFTLRSFSPAHFSSTAVDGSAFVWIDEKDFSLTETPLDLLRAELMLKEEETSR